MKIHIKRSASASEWYWKIIAGNNEVVVVSEVQHNLGDILDTIGNVAVGFGGDINADGAMPIFIEDQSGNMVAASVWRETQEGKRIVGPRDEG